MVSSLFEEDIMLKRISLPGLLLLSALAFLGAPGEPLAASDCGESGEVLCSETMRCTGLWKWKKCRVSASSYYQAL